jgi:hypothetical protein
MNWDDADLAERAERAAGNWQKFQCFCWHRQPDNPERWAILYTHNRDSTLLDQSNAEVIAKELQPFIARGSVIPERHSHWAVGHVSGYAILVFTKGGKITRAFRKWCELQDRLDDYPILDEEDYSQREMDATFENVKWEGGYLARNKWDISLPDDWASEVCHWLSNNNPNALENVDDQGGYPDEEELREAFEALGYLPDEPLTVE